MEQYEMYFTNEYTEDIATELVSKMSIKFDKNKLIIDCNNRDWIYSLVALI